MVAIKNEDDFHRHLASDPEKAKEFFKVFAQAYREALIEDGYMTPDGKPTEKKWPSEREGVK